MDLSTTASNINKEDMRTHASARGVTSRGAALCPSFKGKNRKRKLSGQKKFKKHYSHKKSMVAREPPLLRPAGLEVPKAPSNSTQFIMDNHEDSNLFYNFEEFTEQSVMVDFENDYKTSEEDLLMNCSRERLKRAIVTLESECARLQNTINSRPSVILENLQAILIKLQEENYNLKQANSKICSSDSSGSDSSSDDSSDSDSSCDSYCSKSDCETEDRNTSEANKQFFPV